jgi:predicted amidohydrolase
VTPVRVSCHQLAPVVGDLDGNCELIADTLSLAAAGGAGVVVLPELATSGYVFASKEEAASVALTAADVIAQCAMALSGSTTVAVVGFCERGEDGLLHNSAAIVDADGGLAVYRKTHLWDAEKLVFTPGWAPPPVGPTAAGKLGVLVCYDLEFPELTRRLTLAGAELIAVPTNWPLFDRPDGERPAETMIARAAARTNRVFVACCDRTGTERGQRWTEGTAIVDRDGWVVATPGENGTAMAELELGLARDKSISPRNDVLGDRRPELYQAVIHAGEVSQIP